MELTYFHNEFPKENLQDIYRHIHTQSKAQGHRFLAEFISEATQAVKHEISLIDGELQQLFPAFETILSWAEDTTLRQGPLSGSVDGVLLIVAQVCMFLRTAERDAQHARFQPPAQLAALGVGLFSAAAVALSSNIADLPHFGAQAVRAAFRLGVHVSAVSAQLEPSGIDIEDEAGADTRETWAYVVTGVDPAAIQDELDSFNEASGTAPASKLFLSGISRTSVTVSGPPAKLKSIFQKSRMFRDATSIPLPVYGGMCHAPHIYGSRDVTSIVCGGPLPLSPRMLAANTPLPLRAPSSGAVYRAATGVELFESVVFELLTQAIRFDDVVAASVAGIDLAELRRSAGDDVIVLGCFGVSLPLRDLEKALKDASIQTRLKVYASQDGSEDSNATPRGTAQAKLAIVGMSCRLPGANDLEEFWELLKSGRDVSSKIPADRFDIATHYDPTGKDVNKTLTEYGCFIEEPGLFDAPFFNMSPREAMTVDPQMRLMMLTAYEALEKAGWCSATSPIKSERIGTYYGQAADDYREVNQGQDVGTYYIPGGCRAFGPGRLNYFFKFSGPSYSIDTACSSGLAAIEVACQALWSGAIDMAVTGGVNILTNPDGFTGLSKGHFLTKGHNACKTWDASADGYCRADGIGSLVIKRFEDAQEDNILGVILAAGTNHSADAVSITHPHAGHQSYLSRQVLRQAGVNPLDVSYIELHGTGTQAGDYEEMSGILNVYAPNSSPKRRADQPLHMGSSKANVGHGESVAGTTALIKVLLMLQKNAIPKHVGIKTEINPRFPTDFDKRNVHIPFAQAEWPVSDKKRIATINNFGAAGGNTMMILEEAPRLSAERPEDPRLTHVVAVSAKTKSALAGNIKRLLAHLDDNIGVTDLADLAYTTTARRYQHQFRVTATGADVAAIRKQLVATLEGKIDKLQSVKKDASHSVAFAFTGQGASLPSTSSELYRDVPSFREHIQHLDAIAQIQGFPSFIPSLDGSHPSDYKHSPVITQVSLVCVELALTKYWASLGVIPDIVIGHSLGEYAALCTAGVLSASDAIFLVGRRAQLLTERCEQGSHIMMAVRGSLSAIQQALGDKPFCVACINTPNDTVLSGTKKEMDEVAVILEAATPSMRCIKLDVAFAFHSKQTDPILEEFEAVAKTVTFHEPTIPYISPLLGKVVFDDHTFNASYLRHATRETVDFVTALDTAYSMSSIADDTVWLEMGPHPVCMNFIKSTLPKTQLTLGSIRRGENEWKALTETMSALHLAGLPLDWREFHRPFANRLRMVDLPTYVWDYKNYWLQYNGDWCLTKGNTYYNDNLITTKQIEAAPPAYESLSGLVQNIVDVDVDGNMGTVVMQSDLMQKDFLRAANGHRMNDCGVVTSSIHADITYTLGAYLYRKMFPKAKVPDMNMADLVVTKGLVAQKGSNPPPQVIQVTLHTDNISSGALDLTWQNVEDGVATTTFATAKLFLESAEQWLPSWSPMAHLVHSRIEMLEALALQGKASRFSRNMAYTLFASNLVDYADIYRGMQSVVMQDLEAFADVQLSREDHGDYHTVPPYFIDSVAHLAGFIMNCTDSPLVDIKKNYCVTSGWQSMRFAEPLLPGARYRSYVKMIPQQEDGVFLGDVYIMRAGDGVVVGMVGGIVFRKFPRILLNHFFSAPVASEKKGAASAVAYKRTEKPARPQSVQAVESAPKVSAAVEKISKDHGHVQMGSVAEVTPPATPPSSANSDAGGQETAPAAPAPAAATANSNSVATKALALIAREAALEVADLQDDTELSSLGIDSLMSLVLAEKLKSELKVEINGSLFLDYPTVGDLTAWLSEYYS